MILELVNSYNKLNPNDSFQVHIVPYNFNFEVD